jgi:hypothetical protein
MWLKMDIESIRRIELILNNSPKNKKVFVNNNDNISLEMLVTNFVSCLLQGQVTSSHSTDVLLLTDGLKEFCKKKKVSPPRKFSPQKVNNLIEEYGLEIAVETFANPSKNTFENLDRFFPSRIDYRFCAESYLAMFLNDDISSYVKYMNNLSELKKLKITDNYFTMIKGDNRFRIVKEFIEQGGMELESKSKALNYLKRGIDEYDQNLVKIKKSITSYRRNLHKIDTIDKKTKCQKSFESMESVKELALAIGETALVEELKKIHLQSNKLIKDYDIKYKNNVKYIRTQLEQGEQIFQGDISNRSINKYVSNYFCLQEKVKDFTDNLPLDDLNNDRALKHYVNELAVLEDKLVQKVTDDKKDLTAKLKELLSTVEKKADLIDGETSNEIEELCLLETKSLNYLKQLHKLGSRKKSPLSQRVKDEKKNYQRKVNFVDSLTEKLNSFTKEIALYSENELLTSSYIDLDKNLNGFSLDLTKHHFGPEFSERIDNIKSLDTHLSQLTNENIANIHKLIGKKFLPLEKYITTKEVSTRQNLEKMTKTSDNLLKLNIFIQNFENDLSNKIPELLELVDQKEKEYIQENRRRVRQINSCKRDIAKFQKEVPNFFLPITKSNLSNYEKELEKFKEKISLFTEWKKDDSLCSIVEEYFFAFSNLEKNFQDESIKRLNYLNKKYNSHESKVSDSSLNTQQGIEAMLDSKKKLETILEELEYLSHKRKSSLQKKILDLTTQVNQNASNYKILRIKNLGILSDSLKKLQDISKELLLVPSVETGIPVVVVTQGYEKKSELFRRACKIIKKNDTFYEDHGLRTSTYFKESKKIQTEINNSVKSDINILIDRLKIGSQCLELPPKILQHLKEMYREKTYISLGRCYLKEMDWMTDFEDERQNIFHLTENNDNRLKEVEQIYHEKREQHIATIDKMTNYFEKIPTNSEMTYKSIKTFLSQASLSFKIYKKAYNLRKLSMDDGLKEETTKYEMEFRNYSVRLSSALDNFESSLRNEINKAKMDLKEIEDSSVWYSFTTFKSISPKNRINKYSYFLNKFQHYNERRQNIKLFVEEKDN